jgi:hypothetical protein
MPDSVPVRDHPLSDFQVGEQVFHMHRGINGLWALCEIVKIARKQLKLRYIKPAWDKQEFWVHPFLIRKMTDIPLEWHDQWLSVDKEERIRESLSYRWYRRNRRKNK